MEDLIEIIKTKNLVYIKSNNTVLGITILNIPRIDTVFVFVVEPIQIASTKSFSLSSRICISESIWLFSGCIESTIILF